MAQKETVSKFVNTLLDERERRLVNNCHEYAFNDPAGLPGHKLMVVIYKLDMALGHVCDDVDDKLLEEVTKLVKEL